MGSEKKLGKRIFKIVDKEKLANPGEAYMAVLEGKRVSMYFQGEKVILVQYKHQLGIWRLGTSEKRASKGAHSGLLREDTVYHICDLVVDYEAGERHEKHLAMLREKKKQKEQDQIKYASTIKKMRKEGRIK